MFRTRTFMLDLQRSTQDVDDLLSLLRLVEKLHHEAEVKIEYHIDLIYSKWDLLPLLARQFNSLTFTLLRYTVMNVASPPS